MDPRTETLLQLTRRQLLGRGLNAAGAAALATLVNKDAGATTADAPQRVGGLSELPHHPPTAKRFIYLFMSGGPAQMDLYDYKPLVTKLFDKDLPDSVRQGQRFTTMTSGQKRFPLAPSMFNFEQHGDCGRWVTELLPHTAKVVDDLSFVYSVHTNAINHDPAITFIQTGRELPGWPSLGSWLAYGLGVATENLPNYVVMTPTWSGRKSAQALYNRLWGTGFLPSRLQGVALRAQGDPVLFLSNPEGVDRDTRGKMLEGLAKLNAIQYEQAGDPETQSRTSQYEMAFRMQTSVPDLTDFSQEPKHILDMYGPDVTKPGTFAASCLLARRMAERGVQCIQLFHRGWDQHGNLPNDIRNQCRDIDQPTRALIEDLKRRGMLEDTLVTWGGEFGRTVYCQGNLARDNYGRDHHPRCFTMWMAGGGIQGGRSIGMTDDFSYNIVEDPVKISDINNTILHCLGIDNRRLSIKYQGLDARVTGVEQCRVLKELLG
ncbi:MAG: sulfatase [Planctomycetaceae bacterium]|nr:sulfatase [Planctomycetaceae bacterium]